MQVCKAFVFVLGFEDDSNSQVQQHYRINAIQLVCSFVSVFVWSLFIFFFTVLYLAARCCGPLAGFVCFCFVSTMSIYPLESPTWNEGWLSKMSINWRISLQDSFAVRSLSLFFNVIHSSWCRNLHNRVTQSNMQRFRPTVQCDSQAAHGNHTDLIHIYVLFYVYCVGRLTTDSLGQATGMQWNCNWAIEGPEIYIL